MKNNKSGSALLLVIMTLTMFLLYVSTVWQSTSYTHEILHMRQEYEERFWAMHGLMMWAIALCKENFDTMINFVKYETKTITIKHWPPWSKNSTRSKIEFSVFKKDTLIIKVARDTGNTFLSCILRKEEKSNKLFIESWEEKKEN
jgi:hypothetical protein